MISNDYAIITNNKENDKENKIIETGNKIPLSKEQIKEGLIKLLERYSLNQICKKCGKSIQELKDILRSN